MILTKGTKEALVNDVASAFQVSFLKPDAGAAAQTNTSGAATSNSTSVVITAAYAGVVGQVISSVTAGTTIPAGTRVTAISADRLTLTLSAAATIALSSALSFAAIAAIAGKEVSATAADGTVLRIRGFGRFFLNSLAGTVVAQRAVAPVKGIYTVSAAVPAQITVTGTNTAGPVTVLVKQVSLSPLPEYISGEPGRWYKTRAYTFQVPVNVTATDLLTRLNTEIQNTQVLFPEADEPAELIITSSFAGGVLSLTSGDPSVSLEVSFNDLDARSIQVLTVLKAVSSAPSSEGVNNYLVLKGGRLQTAGTNDPYALPGQLELAEVNANYTSVSFATATARPDLSGQAAADQSVATSNKFLVYVKEGAANEAVIKDVVNFLSRSDAAVIKVYGTQFGANKTKNQFLFNNEAGA